MTGVLFLCCYIEEIPKIVNTVHEDYYWPGAYDRPAAKHREMGLPRVPLGERQVADHTTSEFRDIKGTYFKRILANIAPLRIKPALGQ